MSKHDSLAWLGLLSETTAVLSRLTTLEELYQQAIVHGREKLHFDRLAFFLYDEQTALVQGTFSTDAAGNLRDDQQLQMPLWQAPRAAELIESQERLSYTVDALLYDDYHHHDDSHEAAGRGWQALALLGNGDKVCGWLAADNLVKQEPLQPHQLDVLELYALNLGHLVTLKQTELALRASQVQLQALTTGLEARVQERDRALAASRAKSTFLANMSHELRTPLNAILGYAQLLAGDASLAPDQRDGVETILHSGEHLLSVINNVLDLSKIEAGQMKLQPSAFNLLALLNGLGQMFQVQARAKGLDFVVQRRSTLPELIFADQQKVRQVLINLLGNAVQYTAVGQITLFVWTTHRAGQQTILYLVVEDSGAGIAPHDIERLFLPFEQSGHLIQESEGTGLGLAICRHFVQLLNGHLRVESQLGQGSRFTVELPVSIVSTPTLPDAARRIVGVHPHHPHTPLRILVVDDQPANRQMLELLLGRSQLEVRSVSNGFDALKMTERWQPHLIFMDMRMPMLNGLETTHRLRTMSNGKRVPIIALTASVFEENRNQILEGGCDAFLSKPFREEDVFKLLAHYLPVGLTYAGSPPPIATPSLSGADRLPPPTVLPTAVREALYTAVCAAQGSQILDLITPLQAEQPQLTTQLRHLVHEFRYDIILDWLTQSDK